MKYNFRNVKCKNLQTSYFTFLIFPKVRFVRAKVNDAHIERHRQIHTHRNRQTHSYRQRNVADLPTTVIFSISPAAVACIVDLLQN